MDRSESRGEWTATALVVYFNTALQDREPGWRTTGARLPGSGRRGGTAGRTGTTPHEPSHSWERPRNGRGSQQRRRGPGSVVGRKGHGLDSMTTGSKGRPSASLLLRLRSGASCDPFPSSARDARRKTLSHLKTHNPGGKRTECGSGIVESVAWLLFFSSGLGHSDPCPLPSSSADTPRSPTSF